MKKRLIVDIPHEMHAALKIIAIKYNITLSHYIKHLLTQQIYKEHQYDEIPEE